MKRFVRRIYENSAMVAARERRELGLFWARRCHKTTTIGAMAFDDMSAEPGRTCIAASASLTLGTEIAMVTVSAGEQAMIVSNEAAAMHSILAGSAAEKHLDLQCADSGTGKLYAHISEADFAELYSSSKMEVRLYYDRSHYSRMRVIAPNPATARGWGGKVFRDEDGYVRASVERELRIADDTNITGTSVTATAKKLAILLNISRELLQDSEYDVTARVVRKFLRAAAKRMDYTAFMSDGTNDGPNGAFTGVVNFGTVITAATTHTTVESMSFEDITSVVLGAAEAVLDRQARWWMHPFILIRLLSIKDSNGRPIFLNALEAPTPGGIGSILGFPVTLGHVLPTTNTAGSKVAAFGDPDAYVIGRRQDVEFDFSDHARWTNDQRSFRLIARAAFKGRLASALTVLKTAAS